MNSIFEELSDISKSWYSKVLGVANGSSVSVRVMNDFEAPFHAHKASDEMFIVLSGVVFIDLSSNSITLKAGESYIVVAGVEHRARVSGRAELIVIGRRKCITKQSS